MEQISFWAKNELNPDVFPIFLSNKYLFYPFVQETLDPDSTISWKKANLIAFSNKFVITANYLSPLLNITYFSLSGDDNSNKNSPVTIYSSTRLPSSNIFSISIYNEFICVLLDHDLLVYKISLCPISIFTRDANNNNETIRIKTQFLFQRSLTNVKFNSPKYTSINVFAFDYSSKENQPCVKTTKNLYCKVRVAITSGNNRFPLNTYIYDLSDKSEPQGLKPNLEFDHNIFQIGELLNGNANKLSEKKLFFKSSINDNYYNENRSFSPRTEIFFPDSNKFNQLCIGVLDLSCKSCIKWININNKSAFGGVFKTLISCIVLDKLYLSYQIMDLITKYKDLFFLSRNDNQTNKHYDNDNDNDNKIEIKISDMPPKRYEKIDFKNPQNTSIFRSCYSILSKMNIVAFLSSDGTLVEVCKPSERGGTEGFIIENYIDVPVYDQSALTSALFSKLFSNYS